MPLVSIIVPIYNVANFIEKCVCSLMEQTYENIEFIFVNDCTPDNSVEILTRTIKKYPNRYNRTQIINNEQNVGLAKTRQVGTLAASGEYIIHCDSDDWVEKNMIEELIKVATQENFDMVICDLILDYGTTSQYYPQKLFNPITSKEVQAKIINQEIHGSCCNKLIRRTVCKDIVGTSEYINLAEDELFSIKVLNNNISIVYLPKAFYHYIQTNESSICHSLSYKSIQSRMLVIEECAKLVNKTDFNNFYAMKKGVLVSLFTSKLFKELLQTYPEIHDTVITNHTKYGFFTPLGYFLALALKGFPKLAYYLYRSNLWLLKTGHKIKGHIGNNKTDNHNS